MLNSPSIIQDALASHDQDPCFAIAYFQFNLADPERQNTQQLWASINQQLSRQLEDEAQQAPRSEAPEAEDSEVKPHQIRLSTNIVSRFESIELIIDSVDECEDVENLLEALHEISACMRKVGKIVLSSQLEIDDGGLSQCFNWTSLDLSFDIVKDDVSAYMEERILDNPVLRDLHQYTRDKTKAILLKNAEEM